MNCYIITNPFYEDIICPFVTGLKLKEGDKGRDLLSVNQILIDSKEAFENETFKSAFSKPAKKDTVFIVPELSWDEKKVSVDDGYELALSLLNGKLKDNPFFNLVFISTWRRDQLRRKVKAEHVELVKSFPHVCLSEIGRMAAEKSIPLPAYSDIHFELLKRVVASKAGRLRFVNHKLSYLKETTDLAYVKGEIKQLLAVLSSPSFASTEKSLSGELDRLIDLSARAGGLKDTRKIVDGIFQYVNDLMAKLENKPARKKKSHFSVLIIEDEPYYQKRLEKFFKQYFHKVRAYTNEEIVHANETIQDEAGRYSIVIVDMLYTSTGKSDENLLPFNGFDLVRSLRKEEVAKDRRKSAVRIITALPRHDLARLVNRRLKIESPDIFTKGNGWGQLKGCLVDRMDEILAECSKNDDLFRSESPYPKNGVFAKPGMKEALDANDKKRFKAAIKFANDVVYGGKVLTSNDTLTASGEDDPGELLSHLKATMAHRKLVIEYLLTTKDCKFDERKYREFILDYITDTEAIHKGEDRTPYGEKYILTQLGFSVEPFQSKLVEKDKTNYTRTINLEVLNNLFPEELDAPMGKVSAVMQSMLDDFTTKLISSATIHRRDYACALKESGIDDYLSGRMATVDSLKTLLQKAYEYVSENQYPYRSRRQIHSIFDECLGIKDVRHRYLFIKHQERELTEWADRLLDYDVCK